MRKICRGQEMRSSMGKGAGESPGDGKQQEEGSQFGRVSEGRAWKKIKLINP